MNASFRYLDKYIFAASTYSAIRKTVVLKKHKIECAETKFQPYCNKKYRDVIASELIPLALFAGIMGVYLAPYNILFNDLKEWEIKIRDMNPNDFMGKEDYLHRSAFELILV